MGTKTDPQTDNVQGGETFEGPVLNGMILSNLSAQGSGSYVGK